MRKTSQPRQFSKLLRGGAIWIWGELETPVEGVQGPLVIGDGWMLEMVRFDKDRRTIGVFLAAFGIVTNFDVPEFERRGLSRFVGLSMPGAPPAGWLKESMTVDLGDVLLASSPAELLARFKKPLPYKSIEASPHVSALSLEAKRCIAQCYREDVPIAEIARKLGVSHPHMTRQFKRDFGFTPLSYRHRLRVSEATGRLFRGDDILDVGHDVGFNDTSRFYHDFHKITGVPPGKCRS